MSVAPTIRLARRDEAETVLSVSAAAYIPAYEPLFGWIPKPALENYDQRINDGLVWVLETSEEGVSGVLVLEREPDALLIYSVAIIPVVQGSGLARQLLAHAETVARGVGISLLRLYTNTRMLNNVRLYESCGFTKTVTRPHPGRAGLVLQDMEKRL